jgi:hypothetical protein
MAARRLSRVFQRLFAIQEALDGKVVDWMEKVSDE